MEKARIMSVYENIPFGKSHAISRRDLSELVNMGDRSVRMAVADIRCHTTEYNLPDYVVSDSYGKGYWRTTSEKEIEVFTRQMLARVQNILPAVRNANAFLSRDKQATLFDDLIA